LFFKTASLPVLGVFQASQNNNFRITAQFQRMHPRVAAHTKKAIELVSEGPGLKSIAQNYELSSNIDDYVFAVARAVTANEANGNGDRFTEQELLRYDADCRCLVYETFRNVPLHIEHMADDPRTARGFLPDAAYVTGPEDKYVTCVVAVDTTKDAAYAEGLVSGRNDKFSMGCWCGAVQCSHSACRKIARTENEKCSHLKNQMLQVVGGEVICEDCLEVCFVELSGVEIPADPKAVRQYLMQSKAASLKQNNSSLPPLVSRLLDRNDAVEVGRYFETNINSLPQSMINLAQKLF